MKRCATGYHPAAELMVKNRKCIFDGVLDFSLRSLNFCRFVNLKKKHDANG